MLSLLSFLFKDPVQDSAFSCDFILISPVSDSSSAFAVFFMTVIALKSPGQVFCRMPFNLCLSGVFHS